MSTKRLRTLTIMSQDRIFECNLANAPVSISSIPAALRRNVMETRRDRVRIRCAPGVFSFPV